MVDHSHQVLSYFVMLINPMVLIDFLQESPQAGFVPPWAYSPAVPYSKLDLVTDSD